MATSKTLAPTNVTISIPAMTDAPDQSVNSNCIDKLGDAVNTLNSQITNQTKWFYNYLNAAGTHYITLPSTNCVALISAGKNGNGSVYLYLYGSLIELKSNASFTITVESDEKIVKIVSSTGYWQIGAFIPDGASYS